MMPLNLFLLGLTCFTMGLVVLLRGRGDSEIALGHQFPWLGAYGLLSSVYCWGVMLDSDRIGAHPFDVLSLLILVSLIAAGVTLVRFGSGLIAEAGALPLWLNLLPVVLLIPITVVIAYGIVIVLTASDIQASIIQWSHYLLVLPGDILAALGFVRQWIRLKQADDVPASGILLATAVAFLLNAVFSLTISSSIWLPSEASAVLFGISAVTWRLLLMVLVAVLVTASMNVFEVERKRKIKQLEEARREAQRIALTIHAKTRQETEVWLDALVKIGRRIAGMEEADEVMKDVVIEAREMLAADTAVIALYEGKEHLCYKVQAISGEARVVVSEPVESAVILEAARLGIPLRYPEDIGGIFDWRADGRNIHAETAAMVPLRLNTTLIGALWLGRTTGKPFTCTDLIGLGYVANQAVIALEHASMAAGLQSLAVIDERSRIAREMHDSLAQILGYLGIEMQTLEALVHQGDQAALLAELQEARKSIKSAQADVRENILSLRTALAGKTSPITALKEYVEEFGIQTGVITEIVDQCGSELGLAPLAETECVRIVQEALANVRKHAQAEHVKVTFTPLRDRFEICIADDGVGIAPGVVAHGHFGLQTMRERAEGVGGKVTVTSLIGQGTTVLVSLPMSFHQMKVEPYVTPANARS